MNRKLIIVGAGSVGLHLAANADMYGIKEHLIGFVDDDPGKQAGSYYGYPVLGTLSYVLEQQDIDVVIGIAFPDVKKKIVKKLSGNDSLGFPGLIAKAHSWISADCSIGKGVIIYPGCSINYGSVIGDFVVMNMNCALGHHATVGRYSSLAPGVCFGGHTTVGEGVDIGIGAATIQNTLIGDGAVIGGQSMIIRNVEAGETVVGVPAKNKSI
ncbi:MAG: hypothetical protein H6548_04280 [Chitinophagales bacterium]|nr:hypothetical protein [Chitinophagales bacterium]HQU76203.1 hypothetical protein [Chitinophagales bacterium]